MNQFIKAMVNEMIEEAGHGMLHVFPREKDDGPAFTYTIGLYPQIGYELILFLPDARISQIVLNSIAETAKSGVQIPLDTIIPSSEPSAPTINDWASTAMCFKECDAPDLWDKYAVQAREFFGHEVPVRQALFPDRAGKFPWEPGCAPSFLSTQRILFKHH